MQEAGKRMPSPPPRDIPSTAQFLSLPVGGDHVGRLAFTEDAEPWGQFICDKRFSDTMPDAVTAGKPGAPPHFFLV